MFSTKLTRVAHRATCTAAISNTSTAAHRTTSSLAARRPHQRRHSSSKASCPPDSSPSGSKPAPATKASAGEEKSPISNPTSQPQRTKRVSRKRNSRSTVGVDKAEDQFAGLPAVPHTQHLSPTDFAVSSFFSLHRPLSLATTIPPPSTTDAFENIFQTRQERDPWANGNSAERRPEDVVYALGSLFENLDHGVNEAQDDGVRWEVIQESRSNQNGVTHLDGPPRMKSLDEQIAQFKPFNAPPPPQPFPEEHKASEKKKASKTRQKSYETTIIVTEFTSANGQRTYTASSSPIVRIPSPGEQDTIQEPARDSRVRFPWRERMQERERAFFQTAATNKRRNMLLISVKRQRKLKMKKHKYKKLMKRTRNLRRRQDRA